MEKWTSKQIKQMWIDFFISKNHQYLESASLVPIKDPSLLWINSGVATLKDYFSGKKSPPNPRLVNAQKVIRTNDIENIGLTARHHSFFEMLGNFSIGEYFKKEAIDFAMEFIFQVLKMDRKKIFFTYFEKDLETKELWLNRGIHPSHLVALGRKTNFWDMGQGPCGPNSEIFFDRGVKYELLKGTQKEQGVKLLSKDIENDRYIELWNIVFSTFNNDGEGNYTELAQKNIDTGAGFERIVCIVQDVPTNYDSDLFYPIIQKLETMSKHKYDSNNYFVQDKDQEENNKAYKIITDHIRTISHAISDGAIPSNVSRGYILRWLIRRSLTILWQKLEIMEKYSLTNIISIINQQSSYDIDVKKVIKLLKIEEDSFLKIIKNGKKLILNIVESQKSFSALDAFKMFETYGFPYEFTKEILKTIKVENDIRKNFHIDLLELNQLIKEHTEKSRSGNRIAMKKAINSLSIIKNSVSEFSGYESLNEKSKILFLFDNQREIKKANDISYLILDKTPFYATSGGQRHDKGYLRQGDSKIEILDVFKDKHLNHIHKIRGTINKNSSLESIVDPKIRIGLERNHSSTHLLFWALRKVYGANIIKQLGSDNNEERLTFDFPLDHKPTKKEINKIEKLVNDVIQKSIKRIYHLTTLDEAQNMNVIMTLEEQEYVDPKKVRIVEFNNITKDLCGGTHITQTNLIEKFKIVSVENKGGGVFRIRAITSNALINQHIQNLINHETQILERLISQNKKLDSEYLLAIKTSFDNVENQLKYVQDLIAKARSDFKKFQKVFNEVDLSKFVKEKINSIEFIFSNNIKQVIIKKLGAELREKNPNALIVLLAKTSKNFLVLIASKKYDSKKFSQSLFKKFKGCGGGNQIIVQGSLKKELSKEEFLILLARFNA